MRAIEVPLADAAVSSRRARASRNVRLCEILAQAMRARASVRRGVPSLLEESRVGALGPMQVGQGRQDESSHVSGRPALVWIRVARVRHVRALKPQQVPVREVVKRPQSHPGLRDGAREEKTHIRERNQLSGRWREE